MDLDKLNPLAARSLLELYLLNWLGFVSTISVLILLVPNIQQLLGHGELNASHAFVVYMVMFTFRTTGKM